jgi:hypothetical protein
LGITMPSINKEEPWYKRHRGKLAVGGGLAATGLALLAISKYKSTPGGINLPVATPTIATPTTFTQGIWNAVSSHANTATNSAKTAAYNWAANYLAPKIANETILKLNESYGGMSPTPTTGGWQNWVIRKAMEKIVPAAAQSVK